jgi:hypothetical protein
MYSMEPLADTPELKTQIIALIAALREPAPKGVVTDGLCQWLGVDRLDPVTDAEVDVLLNSPDVMKTIEGDEILYCYAPKRSEEVIAQIGKDTHTAARRAIAAAGEKALGTD